MNRYNFDIFYLFTDSHMGFEAWNESLDNKWLSWDFELIKWNEAGVLMDTAGRQSLEESWEYNEWNESWNENYTIWDVSPFLTENRTNGETQTLVPIEWVVWRSLMFSWSPDKRTKIRKSEEYKGILKETKLTPAEQEENNSDEEKELKFEKVSGQVFEIWQKLGEWLTDAQKVFLDSLSGITDLSLLANFLNNTIVDDVIDNVYLNGAKFSKNSWDAIRILLKLWEKFQWLYFDKNRQNLHEIRIHVNALETKNPEKNLLAKTLLKSIHKINNPYPEKINSTNLQDLFVKKEVSRGMHWWKTDWWNEFAMIENWNVRLCNTAKDEKWNTIPTVVTDWVTYRVDQTINNGVASWTKTRLDS